MRTAPLPASPLDGAVAAGLGYVARLQRPDGAWQGDNDAGALFVGAALAFERALGVLRESDARAGERGLRAAQRDDGSCEAWPHARAGSLEATSFWLAGMRAAGVGDDDPAVVRARAFVDAHGGLRANRVIVQALLAAVGLIPASALPRPPAWPSLVPGADEALGRLLGVNALIPAQTLPALLRALRDGDRPADPVRAAADRRTRAYLLARQDASGSWAGVPYYTMQAALTLHRLGMPADAEPIARAVAFSRSVYRYGPDGLAVGPFFASHWDTAHMARVLADGDPDGEALSRAVAYLVAVQSDVPSPDDWQTPPPGAPATGGWAWQPGNAANPDLDTTAEVLSALARAVRDRPDDATLRASVERGLAWLVSFQNPDGGWAAFSWGKPSAPPGPLYTKAWPRALSARLLATYAELGDPSTADVTGRVLYALGLLGADRADPRVAEALAFLRRHQLPGGEFWARWSVCYLPATAYVVTGALAVGEPADAPWLRRAIDWMLARQNADGGWGESPDVFEDPARAGVGPSSVQVTGVVVWALAEAGLRDDPAVARAVRFLLDRQAADGGWSEDAPYGVVFPHLHYYATTTFPPYFALEALLAVRAGPAPRPAARALPAALPANAMRRDQDRLLRLLAFVSGVGALITLAGTVWPSGWISASLAVGFGFATFLGYLARWRLPAWGTRLWLFGLFAGWTELAADAWLVHGTRTLVYPEGGPFVVASPLYMTSAWGGFLTFGVTLATIAMRVLPARWVALAMGAIFAVYVPAYEHTAASAGWWTYVHAAELAPDVPAYIALGELFIGLALVPVASRLERTSHAGAIGMGVAMGLWIGVAYALAWALVG